MANKRLLDRIKDELAKEGMVARTNASREWLRKKVKEVNMPGGAKKAFVNQSKLSMSSAEFLRELSSGETKMYFYFYDPKTKDVLPYYDTFPLIIPLDFMPSSKSASKKEPGFLGLNLHYIHPKYRMELLDKIDSINKLTNKNYDKTTKLKMTYAVLKNYKSLFEATPCIKHYLFNHVRSKFLPISADEWDIVCTLPFQQFKKHSQVKVWADSKKKF
jgi:hypothetical protein